MMRRLIWLLAAFALSVPVWANEKIQGDCTQGGTQVNVPSAGGQSQTPSGVSTFWQQSFTSCTVTVYVSGTLTLATIYSNNTGTSLGNPFTSDSTGHWFFYAGNGTYDVQFSNGTPTIPSPFSYGDYLTYDSAAGVEYFADQYLSGSTTFGIQEAYTACQSNSLQNQTGCRVGLEEDLSSAAGGSITIATNKPLSVDFRGHTLTCTNTSGVCLTIVAGSYNATQNHFMHGRFVYGGSSSSVTGVEVLDTDYTSFDDITISGFSTTNSVGLELNAALVGHYSNVKALGNTTDALLIGSNVNTFDGACAFSTSSVLAVDIQSSGLASFKGCDYEGNTGKYTVAIDATNGNIVDTVFSDGNYFSTDGDGTSTAATFNLITPSGKYIIGTRIIGNFLGGEAAGTGYAFNYSTSGVPNAYMTRQGNYYSDTTNADNNHPSGNSDMCMNENFTGTGSEPSCDIVLNDHNGGSGTVLVGTLVQSPIFKSGNSNPSATGTVRLNSSDTLNFRNQANSADLTGLGHDSSDHIVADTGTGAGFLVQSKFLLPTYSFGSFPSAPLNGTVIFCVNCTPNTRPCTGSGSGALAVTYGSNEWSCEP